MWEASLMFKVPALRHHPGNLCFRLYHGMELVCGQHLTIRIPEIPTMLKNSNNKYLLLLHCYVFMYMYCCWIKKKKKKNSNNLIQCDISILHWKYRISYQGHRCEEAASSYKLYISFIPKMIFSLSAATLRQKVVVFSLAHGGHFGKWRPYWNQLDNIDLCL